ncbi:MAG: RecQ family ATP-dependent DNA helicase [Paludibacteraceae bacterium]|nr:RecQ family ATP-dependent DNA helicase [Paludibacteraceae bacterium]
MSPRETLHTYFGYDDFRPLQEDIISRIDSGRDTLALMPTGGGKSLCFQVPTLMRAERTGQALCLVVTPLIALMKDQVENLRRRDIRAAAIYTGMSLDKQRTALDNCQFGPYRFLYVSPERLESEAFRKRLSQLPVTLIAVDEAHCISQWGYDFRPSYLRIAQIRTLLPQVPVLALTATATPEVVDDIQLRLTAEGQQPDWQVFRRSFRRDNLSYIVRKTEQKDAQLLHILTRVPGSGIVYVRNRKRAQDLAEWLNSRHIQADFYHAGLDSAERSRKQEELKQDRTRIIVCTNAFGMGIDKPDVRIVIHYDLPDNPEAYFQEAGRAGRDGLRAYCVLLYAKEDRTNARKRVTDNYPEREFIEQVYHKTCDYLQVGAGSGLGHTFALHMEDLCRTMHLPVLQTYSALHLLAQAGYIDFNDDEETSPRLRINVSRNMLDTYELTPDQRELLYTLLRSYPGITTDLHYIREEDVRHELLVSLAQRGIVTYVPRTVACRFTFTQERQTDIYLSKLTYEDRRERYTDRLRAMIEYAEQDRYCRQQVLLSWFGEDDAAPCNTCDVCLARKKATLSP